MPKERKASKSRGWCITVNNIEDWDGLQKRVAERKQVRYFCGQLEVGEQSSVRHLQAYVEFRSPVGLAAVRKLFPRCHAEARRGSPEEARSYCSKEETRVAGSFFECGELPLGGAKRQGAREDLDAVRIAVQGGAGVRELIEKHPVTYARYTRFCQTVLMQYVGRRSWKSECRVYVGPTGCGKTSAAYAEFPDLWSKPEGAWFDSYDGQAVVLIDDFRGGRDCGITFAALLQLLDRYGMVVPVKGSFQQWRPRVIIITSNIKPEFWYPWEDKEPLMRRIDVLKVWEK